MKVKLLDYMGSDITVVNAARVSFNKKSEVVWCAGQYCDDRCEQQPDNYTKVPCPDLNDKDKKLINYLAKHGHWTPFGHPQISLHFKVPIFVARQLHKHQVGFVVNEVSRRYVDEEPCFFIPLSWRKRSLDRKQGSSEGTVDLNDASLLYSKYYVGTLKEFYNELIKDGVAPEQARMVLPLSTYTEFWMTGSLAAWSRLYKLRIQPDAQKEVQEIAGQIGEIVAPLFPVSWKALNE